MTTPGGYVAYNAEGQPCGMGPTRQAAIADARQRGCASGRLRRATQERVREASRNLPAPTSFPAPAAPREAGPPPGLTPSQAYFAAVQRGDYDDAKRLLAHAAPSRVRTP